MADNLTSKQIKTWKNSVDKSIKKLIKSLETANGKAANLSKVTKSSGDENNLSYRFNDLATVTKKAKTKLNTFMTKFDDDLSTYIEKVVNAEEATAENVRKQIDQFAEGADKIGNLEI